MFYGNTFTDRGDLANVQHKHVTPHKPHGGRSGDGRCCPRRICGSCRCPGLRGLSFASTHTLKSDDLDKRPLSALLGALPSDLAASPGFEPTDEQILAEVEERAWIVQFQGEDAFQALMRKNPRADEFALAMSFYAGRGGATSPEVQKLMDAHAALNLLVRGLRRSMGKPEEPNAGFHFTLPQLPPEVAESYRRQGLNPAAAYAGFHTVKAALSIRRSCADCSRRGLSAYLGRTSQSHHQECDRAGRS